MFHGYLEMGGDEVLNRSRAYGYALTAGCPLNWFVGDQSLSLRDALGDPEYSYANIDEAPWYDASRPETARFLGAYPTKILGIPDSTRAAQVTEGIGHGGTVQSSRRAVKSIRATALLVGRGADALEAGVEWLNSAIDPAACGSHDSACGETDLCFFTADPPVRGAELDFTEWTEARRNLVVNPSAETNVLNTGFVNAGTSPSLTRSTVRAQDGAASFLFAYGTGAIIGDAGPSFGHEAGSVAAGVTFTVSAWVYQPTLVGGGLKIGVFGSAMGVTGTLRSDPTTVVGAWARVSLTFVTEAAGSFSVGIFNNTGSVAGATFNVDSVLVEKTPSLGTFFTGATSPEYDADGYQIVKYSWAATTDNSASIQLTRSRIMSPWSDEDYEEVLAEYRRRMHGVMATSGPLILQEFSREGFYAYIVEFTLTAGKPFVYSMPRPVELPPVVPFVVQDLPRNEVKYPSAELAAGTIVTAVNLAPNPSVEVNATDWAAAVTTVSGSAATAFLTSGRTTEFAAESTASFRARILGDGVTASSGVADLDAYSEAAIAAGSNRRVSFNMWAALVNTGAGTLTSLQVTYEFFNGGSSLGAATNIGSHAAGEFSGKAVSLAGVAVPASATKVRVRARARVSWASSATPASNSDIRLYCDALAVTIP